MKRFYDQKMRVLARVLLVGIVISQSMAISAEPALRPISGLTSELTRELGAHKLGTQKLGIVPAASLNTIKSEALKIEHMIKQHRLLRYVGNTAAAALTIYMTGQFFGFWGQAEQGTAAPACAACLQAANAPDNRGWMEWMGDGLSNAGSAVTSPRWWGRTSYGFGKLLALTTCHSIVGNNVQNMVSKIYHPDVLSWFVMHKTSLRKTIFKLRYYAQQIEKNETEKSADVAEALAYNKNMLKAMTAVLVRQVEKIAGYMYYRSTVLKMDDALTTDIVQHMISKLQVLVDDVNTQGTISDKQIEDFYWEFLRALDNFMGLSAQEDQAEYSSLVLHEKRTRLKEEMALLPEELRETVITLTRERKRTQLAQA